MQAFDYSEAFSRNLGILDEDQQQTLRESTVCIAGMGGVGGDYLVTLARSGVGRFRVADFDAFELANFNRQYGATMETIGRPKVEVMAEIARQINPEIELESYPDGLTEGNLDEFLRDADLVIDGIDLFAPDWHRRLISAAQARNIPAIAAVPVGFGAGMVGFNAAGMSFDEYFAWNPDAADERKVLQLALGFAPAGYHLGYIQPESVDLKNHRGPSSIVGCKACAAIIGAQAIQAILHPSELKAAPWYTHFDLKLMKFKHSRLRWGNKGPLQRLKAQIASHRLL